MQGAGLAGAGWARVHCGRPGSLKGCRLAGPCLQPSDREGRVGSVKVQRQDGGGWSHGLGKVAAPWHGQTHRRCVNAAGIRVRYNIRAWAMVYIWMQTWPSQLTPIVDCWAGCMQKSGVRLGRSV